LMGSTMALCWSCAVMLVLKYIFGLVFVQGLAEYLIETPRDEIDGLTRESIATYWNTVLEGILTLYKATTGGHSWAELAWPIRQASASTYYAYYVLFLLYVAFFMVALLNVLTGLFVDAVVRVRDKDNADMIDLVLEDARSGDKHGQFKEFILDQMSDLGADDGRRFSWSIVRDHRNEAPIQELFRSLQIDFSEAKSIFKNLQMQGEDTDRNGTKDVDVEEFLQICESKLKNGNIVLAALEYETKQLREKITPMIGRTNAGIEKVSTRLGCIERSLACNGKAGGAVGAPRSELAPHMMQDSPGTLLD